MKFMAADAIGGGKGLMQAEPASFVGLFFMAGETQGSLRGNQQFLVHRLMRLMTGVAAFVCGGLVAAAAFSEGCLFVTRQAKGFLVMFQLRFTRRTVAIMTCKALPLDYGFMIADHLWLHPFAGHLFPSFALFIIRFGRTRLTRLMAVEADLLCGFGQEQSFIAGVNGMATGAEFVGVGFVDAAFSGFRFLVATQAELIGRGLGGDFLLYYLMAGITLAFCHRFVEIFFQEIWRITGMWRMAL